MSDGDSRHEQALNVIRLIYRHGYLVLPANPPKDDEIDIRPLPHSRPLADELLASVSSLWGEIVAATNRRASVEGWRPTDPP